MERIAKIRRLLTKTAWNRTLAEMPQTITAAKEMARSVKRKNVSINATGAMIFELVRLLEEARKIAAKKPGRYCKPSVVSLPDRLIRWRRKTVVNAADYCLRTYARQSSTLVFVSPEFAATTAQLAKDEGWIDYKRHGYRMGITDVRYHVTVQRGWMTLPPWLRTCDGILTIAANRCTDQEQTGETLYRARWVIQKAGDIAVKEGFILRSEVGDRAYTAHGKSPGACRGVITRQLPEFVAAENERERKRAVVIEKLKSRIQSRLERGNLNGFDVMVTLGDSTRVGNCKDGTEHWVNRHMGGRSEASVPVPVAGTGTGAGLCCGSATTVRRVRSVNDLTTLLIPSGVGRVLRLCGDWRTKWLPFATKQRSRNWAK